MSDKIERKITVIFATDIVGYSRHMEKNESETVKNLRACERILTKLFKKYDGSIFNTGGDSFLAEFSSAVNAVECAVAFQKDISIRNGLDKTSVKLMFRIGINAGDVIKEKGNLLGDGVNIAARLESLAQAGGITISKGVYDYIKGKTNYEYSDLGIQKVKQNEFYAYDLLIDKSHKRNLKTQNSKRSLFGIITVALLISLAGLFYFFKGTQDTSKDIVFEDSNRVSLLILPFEFQSTTQKDNYMGESITTHISTVLSGFDELFVFDITSANYFIKQNIPFATLNTKYGVQFLLEGSIQTTETRARINVKLRDLRKNLIIWSEILDFQDTDIFAVQDDLSDSIIENVIPGALALSVADSRVKQKFTPEVHLNRLKGRVAYESHSAEGLYEYERLLKINRELEPSNPYLDMDEAWLLMGKVWFGLAQEQEFKKLVGDAYRLTMNTVNADPDFSYASNLAAMLERNYLGKLDVACSRIDKLIQISRDESNISMVANLTRHCQEYEKSLALFKKVLKRAPYFALWFKKDYAWTFLISSFDNESYNYSEARDYIKSQLLANYDEEGIHELWLTMLAYIEYKDGDKKSAIKYIEEQQKMDFAIGTIWKDSYPAIINENKDFKKEFFRVLQELGVKGLL